MTTKSFVHIKDSSRLNKRFLFRSGFCSSVKSDVANRSLKVFKEWVSSKNKMSNSVFNFLNGFYLNDVGNLSAVTVPIIIVTGPPTGLRTVFSGYQVVMRLDLKYIRWTLIKKCFYGKPWYSGTTKSKTLLICYPDKSHEKFVIGDNWCSNGSNMYSVDSNTFYNIPTLF